MKKFLSSIFIVFLSFLFQQASSQTLYKSNVGNGYSYNPGLGGTGIPTILFDDVNIADTLIPDTDSMLLLNVKVSIVRAKNSPASVIKFYATKYNPASVGYDSMPAIPPVLIGTINLPANPGERIVTMVDLGNPSNSLFTFAADRNNVNTGYTTIYIGLSFSIPTVVGWELADGPDFNTDLFWLYKRDNAVRPRYATYFGTIPKASFNLEVMGRRKSKPVPVSLTSFDVQKANNNNVLAWHTSQESNSHYYAIEHSRDGNNFAAIGQVAAAGNSTNTSNYNYTHENPAVGINYYRLKIADLDNAVNYSAIKSVKNATDNLFIKAYPNPASEILYLDIPSDKAERATISVTNVAGQVVLKDDVSVTLGINTAPVKISNLPSGTYIIKIQLVLFTYKGYSLIFSRLNYF